MMILDTDSSVVVVIGVRSRSVAAIGGRTSIPGIFTPRSGRSAGWARIHDKRCEGLVDVLRIWSWGSFVLLLSGVLELSMGPLDLAEEVLEGGDSGVDLGKATRELITSLHYNYRKTDAAETLMQYARWSSSK
jgi:hypothetical protein